VLKPLFPLRLVMLTALSSAMLNACASDPAAEFTPPIEPNPVIREVTVVERICPDELTQDVGELPAPATGSVVRHNAEGGDWIDGVIAAGRRAIDLFNDAKAQCPAAPEDASQ